MRFVRFALLAMRVSRMEKLARAAEGLDLLLRDREERLIIGEVKAARRCPHCSWPSSRPGEAGRTFVKKRVATKLYKEIRRIGAIAEAQSSASGHPLSSSP